MRGKFFIAEKVRRLPSRNFARFLRSRREFRGASYNSARITSYPSLLLCRVPVFSNKFPAASYSAPLRFSLFLSAKHTFSRVVGSSVSRENYVSSTSACTSNNRRLVNSSPRYVRLRRLQTRPSLRFVRNETARTQLREHSSRTRRSSAEKWSHKQLYESNGKYLRRGRRGTQPTLLNRWRY